MDFIAAKVEVDIKDKKISNIKLLEHKNERGGKAEVIPERVVEAQSLKVDTISGATNSSKVILEAIQNALTKAESKSGRKWKFSGGILSFTWIFSWTNTINGYFI